MFLLDSLFPARCVGCGEEGSWLCHNCAGFEREAWPRFVDSGVMALLPFKEKVVREGIHHMKYNGVDSLAERLVEVAWAEELRGFVAGATLVPVPTSFARKKKRGYNQAELIARALARWLGVGVDPDVLKKTSWGTQVGKSREERGAAGYALRRRPAGPIVLVDDLYTTGSTVTACRKALGEEVKVVVLARD